jgi:glucokinase
MSVGGVVVDGGIAPKILPVIQNGSLMRRFTSKRRFALMMESLEVRVALNLQGPCSLGAAHIALAQ